jgi:hypothetical protein
MNTEMQRIMEKRRRNAEAKARNGGVEDLEGSLTEMDLHNSASNHSQGSAGENLTASGSFMSEDLQVKMERQRRLADGEIVEGGGASLSPVPSKQTVKGAEMSPDLKAAMTKRRQISDSKKEAAAAAPTVRGTVPRHSRRSSTGGGPSKPDGGESEVHRQSRRGSTSGYVSSKTKAANSTPPPPPPPVHASDEGSLDGDEGEDGAEGKPRRSHKKSPPPRRSRPKKEETAAPMELDIDEDTSDEEEEEEEENEETQAKEAKPRRRHRKKEDESEDISPKRRQRNMRRQSSDAGEDIDDMSIDQSVDSSRSGSKQSPKKATLNLPKSDESPKRRSRDDTSLDQSVESKSSSRSGSMMSPKKSSSSRPPKTSSSGSHAKRRQSTGVGSPAGTASGSGSSTDDDEAKLRRRSGRRKSTAGGHDSGIPSASGSGSSRRSMKKTGSSRSVESDEGIAAAGPSNRNMLRRSSTRSMDAEPIMEDHSLSPLKDESNKKMEVVASESAWGEFPAFADANEGDTAASGFSGGFTNFSGGGNLGASVSNFGFTPSPADSFSPPAANKKGAASTDPFSAAFSPDADAVFSEQPAFEANTFGGSGDFDLAGGFDQSSSFAAPPAPAPKQKVWDSTPLTNVPKRELRKLSLIETTTVRCVFQGAPSTNPMNGNIIFCSSRGGVFSIHEIDPHKNNVQVSSVAILSTELQRKLASKYNASAHSVDSVIALTAGLHRAHGQTRVRVAAILDLRVLESDQVMRIVAVWQWGYGAPHPVLLQHVMIPPSGGDFSYDAASLQVADGLLFIAGTSKKGPCVFASKPAVRETWSANFLTGKGRVSAMAVTPDIKRAFPYLAVALTDQSLSVWTYGSALASGSSKGNEASPRWLFPMCRLESQSILAEVPATPLNDDESGGKGKRSTRFQ